jgi:Rps23 Pro-64 3,4-dihydroxylase Tpa1-like proline 4-hydroxylase
MLFGNFANQVIGDSCMRSEPGQMQLAHFSVAAHVVHQVERVSFAPDKSHDVTSNFRYPDVV